MANRKNANRQNDKIDTLKTRQFARSTTPTVLYSYIAHKRLLCKRNFRQGGKIGRHKSKNTRKGGGRFFAPGGKLIIAIDLAQAYNAYGAS